MSEEHDRVVTESILRSALTSALVGFENRLAKCIREDGEQTRRHMDAVADRIVSHVKRMLEVNARHGIVLDNLEERLQKIEKLA